MLKIYNSLSRKKEQFNPLRGKSIGMYVCGPTVYGPGHVGHARTYIAFDVVRRYLEYSGYGVKLVVNITDVHDDIIEKASQQNKTIFELAERNIKLFFADMEKLLVKPADVNPKVTAHIPEIIEMIKALQKKGFAYETDDGVYFNIAKFGGYGKLSGAKAEKGVTGKRVQADKYEKESVQDFALWKKAKELDPFWESPWGKGRPGWHIECSAMSTKYLGKVIDIHAGAVDLIFPHHENEIAQSECATGKSPFVRYWMHAGLLYVNGQKMAKSLGNFITIPEFLEKHDALDFRFFIAQVHYKSILDYTVQAISDAAKAREKWNSFIQRLQEEGTGEENRQAKKIIAMSRNGFEKAMDDDFNTPNAWASLQEMQRKINSLLNEKKLGKKNAENVIGFLREINNIFMVFSFEKQEGRLPKEIMQLINEREQLRKQKKWLEADALRAKLLKEGIQLMDTEQGTKWKIVKK